MNADLSIFRNLAGTELDAERSQAATIADAANAIDACSMLLSEFIADDETNDTIPADIKDSHVRNGLIRAVLIAARRLADVGEFLEVQVFIAERGDKS